MNKFKKLLSCLIVLVIVGINVYEGVKQFNEIVVLEEKVKTAWGQVENAYQSRMDRIPNLNVTVKGYAEHEYNTLTAVINARARATQVTVDPTNLSPEDIAKFRAAQSELSGALNRLMVSVERYPELKANESFLQFQSEIVSTENRITDSRRIYNESANAFNKKIRKFPINLIARMCGIEKKGYFEAEDGAEKAPKVSFD